MISKELLIEVLNCKDNVEFYQDDNYIVIGYDGENYYDINIYELAHKCKEWANHQGKRGYRIESKVSGTLGQAQVTWTEKGHTDYHGNPFELDRASQWFKIENNNEPEAIFKACQWILENKNEK